MIGDNLLDSSAERIAFVAGYVLYRALAVVVPVLPGLLFDWQAIRMLGWPLALLFAEVGVMIGAVTSFAIARHYREPVVRRFVRLEKLRDWEAKLPETDRLWAWVAVRLPSNVAFDLISYAAGLTQVPLRIFFWSTLFGNLPLMVAFFVATGKGIDTGRWGWYVGALCLLVAAMLVGVLVKRSKGRG